MIAVIFESWPAHGRKADHLRHIKRPRGEIGQNGGIYLGGTMRVENLADPDKSLAAPLWRDQACSHAQAAAQS
jgi:hypothetical protein